MGFFSVIIKGLYRDYVRDPTEQREHEVEILDYIVLRFSSTRGPSWGVSAPIIHTGFYIGDPVYEHLPMDVSENAEL